MNTKRLLLVGCLLTMLIWLAACQGQAETVEVTRTVTETIVMEGEAVEVTRVVTEVVQEVVVEVPDAEPAPSELDAMARLAGTPLATIAPSVRTSASTQRFIIKDGRMTLIVNDTETAVNSAIELTVGLGGYIISQQVYDDDRGYRFAEMRLAFPVFEFEEGMRRLRRLGEVASESASGEDVTDEFVDLNSRLGNLEATRDRILGFLDEARTVEQALEINEQLKQIEEEIAIIQGRINYIRDRSAFSTVDLSIRPFIPTPTPTNTPTITPTPTATPTATPTMTPTPRAWNPGEKAGEAMSVLEDDFQDTADFFIYYGIVTGPWLLLFGLLGWLTWRVWRRWQMSAGMRG